jgi:nucleotide-binding universal stress UspA family protein
MTFQHVLVATDFSDCSARAVELAVALAERFDAALTLVHTWQVPVSSYGAALYLPGDLASAIEAAALAQLASTGEAVKARLPRATTTLRQGEAWQEILAAAESAHADLIVVGTHGRQGLTRALLGSVAEKVVRLASVPVLSVH